MRLETGKANRLSYLPNLLFYFGEDGVLRLRNVGKGLALNPTITKIKGKERGNAAPVINFLEPNAEIKISSEFLGISDLEKSEAVDIKISFNCPYESDDGLDQWTEQIIEWNLKRVSLGKKSWHADYRR